MSFLYTGAYTEPPLGRSEGIVVYRYDDTRGTIERIQTIAGFTNPTFLATSADERFVYAVCEAEGGAVAAFERDPETGKIAPLNQQSSGGNGPAHISIDPSGRYALVANYGSGSVATLPIEDEGSLGEVACLVQHEGSGPNTDRQEGPHAHMIIPTPDGRYVVAADLGSDEVITYRLDTATGQLERRSTVRMAPGAGPRHLVFAPNRSTAWVMNELDSTITTCDYDPETGALTVRQTISAVAEGHDAESFAAHIVVSEDGRFVYGSNRDASNHGHDSIVTCEVNPDTGELTAVDHTPTEGSFPRHFAFDPTGTRLLVANQKGDNLAVLVRDTATGRLSKERVIDGIPSTVCLVFCG
ncbi:MAG: lactonase family protein [Chloroflexota bacterium]|nr:lactonase family protein [Chloroflexota bacterium]